ncbi:MAG: O-antigen ligase family protein [Herpetosiphonaceae bacterium]|nr:O-antigen ligase family protein [Herpetosiphonaceae bacterium]
MMFSFAKPTRPALLDLGIFALALLCVAVIVGLPPLLALGLLLGGAILAGTLIDPVVGLYLTVASVMLQELVPLPLGLSVTHVVGAMALGTWVLSGLARRELRIERSLLVPWGLFLGALLLAAALTDYNAVDSLKQVVRWILAFLAFVVTVVLVTTPRRAIGLIVVVLSVGVLEALVGLQQFIQGAGPFALGEQVRAYGTIGKPNTFAGFLGMIWPLGAACSVGLLWQWWQQRQRGGLLLAALLAGGATLVVIAGIGVSFSRGAWLGSLAGALAMLALVGGRRAVPLLALLLAIGGLALAQPALLPGALTERLSSITDNLRIFDAGKVTVTDDNFAVVERMAHWQAGANMALDHPLIGVGPDNFNRAYPKYFVGRWSESQGHAHNYYIHIAAEAGILGLIAYLILVGSVVATGWRALQATRGTPWFMVAVGGCGIIAAVQVHSVFENLHVLNFGIHLSAIWGLLAALALRRGLRP